MARQTLPAPTVAYILALKRELESQFGTQDEQIRRTRSVREMTLKVPLEQRVTDIEVRDPTVAQEIGHRSAILNLVYPALRVTAAKETDATAANATLREDWTQEVLREASQRLPGLDAIEQARDCQAGDGGAWLKCTFQKDLWDERYRLRREPLDDDGQPIPGKGRLAADEYNRRAEDAKKEAGSPYLVESIDPLTVYPVWSGTRLTEVLVVTERPVISALREHMLRVEGGVLVPDELGRGSSENELTQQGISHVTQIEHWTNTYVTYVVGLGKAATTTAAKSTIPDGAQWKHGYKQVPFFQAPGIMFGYWTQRKVGWGVAEMMRWLVEYRSFLMTLHADMTATDAAKPLQGVATDGAMPFMGPNGKPRETELWGRGKIYWFQPGQELKPIPVEANLDAVIKQIAMVTQMITDLSGPKLPPSLGSGMEGAGFAITTIINESAIQDNPFVKHFEQALAEMTRFMWRLAKDKIKEPIWVQSSGEPGKKGTARWLVLDPAKDLADAVGINWDAAPERPGGQIVQEQYWASRVKNASASIDMMVEGLGGNPEKVRQERAVDEMRQTPEYKNWRLTETFQAAGMGHLLQQTAQAQQVVSTGEMPPPPGSDFGTPNAAAEATTPPAPAGGDVLPGATTHEETPGQSAAPLANIQGAQAA